MTKNMGKSQQEPLSSYHTYLLLWNTSVTSLAAMRAAVSAARLSTENLPGAACEDLGAEAPAPSLRAGGLPQGLVGLTAPVLSDPDSVPSATCPCVRREAPLQVRWAKKGNKRKKKPKREDRTEEQKARRAESGSQDWKLQSP